MPKAHSREYCCVRKRVPKEEFCCLGPQKVLGLRERDAKVSEAVVEPALGRGPLCCRLLGPGVLLQPSHVRLARAGVRWGNV